MRILVVDDELQLAVLLGRRLQRLGHEAIVAVDPQHALELLNDLVEAIITDIDMPLMDGVQLAERVRRRFRDMPVAFCTGSCPHPDLVGRAAKLGPVLAKSCTLDELQTAVEGFAAETAA